MPIGLERVTRFIDLHLLFFLIGDFAQDAFERTESDQPVAVVVHLFEEILHIFLGRIDAYQRHRSQKLMQ